MLERTGPVARLRLDRPTLHNAFDAGLIDALTSALDQLADDPDVRAVVLEGSGASFSAGADLHWMRGMASASEAANREDALALARLMRTLDELPKPTIARVHGAAFGGGVGLVACCDIAIGVPEAKFGLTESKLGLLPAVISPYVIAAIGPREARRWAGIRTSGWWSWRAPAARSRLAPTSTGCAAWPRPARRRTARTRWPSPV